MVDAEEAGHGVGHLRGVQRADEGQVATGGVGKPGHRTGGVGSGLLAHRVDRARRAEGDDHVTRPDPEAQRGRHVVARTRGDDRGVPGPGVVERSEDLGDDREPVPLAVHDPQQVPAVGALVGRPVARPRRVAAVGREPAGQAPREPVVGQQHPGQPGPVLRLAAVQPRQLRHREGRHRHAAAGLRPRGRAPIELLDQPACVGRGLRVVPELGRPDDLAGGVHGHHAVLLAGDGDRRDRRAGRAASQQLSKAAHQASGSCSERGGWVGGWGAVARPCRSPVWASRSSTLVDWVEESTPATRGIPGGLRRAGPAQRPPTRWSCSGAGACVSAVICASRGPWDGPSYEGRPRAA